MHKHNKITKTNMKTKDTLICKIVGISTIVVIVTVLSIALILKNNKTTRILSEKPTNIISANISTKEASLFWIAKRENIKYTIHYKEASNSGIYKKEESVKEFGDKNSNNKIYTARISNLKSNTKYTFRIQSENKAWEEIFTFKTKEISNNISLPEIVTGTGDTNSLYLAELDKENVMLDTQEHGTWAFDSQGKEYELKKYAEYTGTTPVISKIKEKLLAFKNKFVTFVLAGEPCPAENKGHCCGPANDSKCDGNFYKYPTDNTKDGMIVSNASDWNRARHCRDLDGCECDFESPGNRRMTVPYGHTCYYNGWKSEKTPKRCCVTIEGGKIKKSMKYVDECYNQSSGKNTYVREDIAEAQCKDDSTTPPSTPTPPVDTPPANTGDINTNVHKWFPSDGYSYAKEDLFKLLITGDYKKKDNDKDQMNVNEAWKWTRECKDVDGCECIYPDGSSLPVAVGETCLQNKQKKDTEVCCLYENQTKRTYTTAKECMKKSNFGIIEETTKEACQSEYVCCEISGEFKYKLESNCKKANGTTITGATKENCKKQEGKLSLSKGTNFIEAYYLVNPDGTRIKTAKQLIELSNNKISAIGLLKNNVWGKTIKYENGTISGEDFELLPNEAYLIQSTADTEIPIQKVVTTKKINLNDYAGVGWNLVPTSSVSDKSDKTSTEIMKKNEKITQIAQWSKEISSFRYAIKDISNNTFGDVLTITDQEGVFIKTVD